jgi:hypothetical protein
MFVLPRSFDRIFPMILYILIGFSCLIWNRYLSNKIKQAETEIKKTTELTHELQ